ncbi:MAG: baseplate assembly protein [Candidatus Binataceae bacterium]
MGGGAPNLPPPAFVNDAAGLDPNKILAEMIEAFEAATGRKLQPAQVERLLINLYAYRESLVRNAIQYSAEQNLLAFARFPMIDYLGGLLGVTRLPAQAATTILEFTLQQALTVNLTIAAATQAGTTDGLIVFATDAELMIVAGQTSSSMSATAQVAGAQGNGYIAGQVSVQLNPNVHIRSARNTTVTSGGSAPETDDHLRTRIQAAPNEFSVAGPVGAYRFFALSADPTIIDALVKSPAPGEVTVHILTGPITAQPAASPNTQGVASAALLDKVQQALNADQVRPLTDTVAALAVSEVDYEIAGTVTIYADADPTATMAAALAAARQFAVNLASRIQRDIVPSEIVAALSVPGVYDVELTAPPLTHLAAGEWANCTAITLGEAVAGQQS